jgi:hypothetical protein
MALYNIWMEGYVITGQKDSARLLGTVEADTFEEACDKLCSPIEWQERNGSYSKENKTVWGCRLFPDETRARASFG